MYVLGMDYAYVDSACVILVTMANSVKAQLMSAKMTAVVGENVYLVCATATKDSLV